MRERQDQWEARLGAAPPPVVFVAENETRIVGFVSVGSSREVDAHQSVGEIYSLYVDPPYWGQGVGKTLWFEAESFAVSTGWTSLTLWVLEGNARARSFYESVGLSQVNQRKVYQRDGHTALSLRYEASLVSRKQKG